jgi:S1-C subfamily serine protease
VNAPALTETQGMLNLQGTATSTIGTAVALANNATVPSTLTLAPLPTSRALGYVGIEVEDSEAGVRVTGVRSAAQQAGIREGDFIEAVDVQRVVTRDEFLANMDAREPFSLVTFRLRRGNTTIYIRATLGLLDFAAPASG